MNNDFISIEEAANDYWLTINWSGTRTIKETCQTKLEVYSRLLEFVTDRIQEEHQRIKDSMEAM